MKVIEAHRTRHLVLRFDRGEELPAALQRALDEYEVTSGWIEGFGTLDSAELAVFDTRQRSYSKGRKFEPGGDVVSLGGNVSRVEGTTCVRLFATLARESDTGLAVVAGELLSARAFALEVHVTTFEDGGALARVADDRTGLLALVRSSGVTPAASSGDTRPRAATASDTAPAARRPEASSPSSADPPRNPMGSSSEAPQHLSPPRRERPVDDPSEVYPEVGDIATHFHFGECKILSSDGDKIRLQQLKDLRVREVSLGALRTELVSHDVEANHRHFKLLRKN